MAFEVKIGNNTLNYLKFWYEIFLNEINHFEVTIDGTAGFERTNFAIGSIVEIYKNGTLVFSGEVEAKVNVTGGGMILRGLGEEIDLANTDGSGTVYPSTASATIFTAMINSTSKFSAGTINAGETVDFTAHDSQSVWNLTSRLRKITSQYIYVDYANHEIDILDSLGSTKLTMNEEVGDIKNVRFEETKAKGLKVIVYGKGDGEGQITATATDGSYVNGDPIHKVIDRTIISTATAQLRANAELAKVKQNIKIYSFIVVDITRDVNPGDTFKLYADSASVAGDTVKVTSVRRGDKPSGEYLQIQVVNEDYDEAVRGANNDIVQLEKQNRESSSIMQGSGNTLTFFGQDNANNDATSANDKGMTIEFNLPASFIQDEAGNIRVESFTLDFDVDPYKRNFQREPVDSGHDHTDPLHASLTSDTISSIDSSLWSENVNTVWDAVDTLTLGSGYAYPLIWVLIEVSADSWSGTDTIGFKVNVDGTTYMNVQGISYDTTRGNILVCYPVYLGLASGSDRTLILYMYSGGNNDYTGVTAAFFAIHSHNISAHNVDVDYADVVIGDAVDDAAALNGSNVEIYLDYHNGSAWVNKHSIVPSPAKTLQLDVDLTNSGTLPDAAGLWRVRIGTNNATPDFVRGIIKMKHSLDN